MKQLICAIVLWITATRGMAQSRTAQMYDGDLIIKVRDTEERPLVDRSGRPARLDVAVAVSGSPQSVLGATERSIAGIDVRFQRTALCAQSRVRLTRLIVDLSAEPLYVGRSLEFSNEKACNDEVYNLHLTKATPPVGCTKGYLDWVYKTVASSPDAALALLERVLGCRSDANDYFGCFLREFYVEAADKLCKEESYRTPCTQRDKFKKEIDNSPDCRIEIHEGYKR